MVLPFYSATGRPTHDPDDVKLLTALWRVNAERSRLASPTDVWRVIVTMSTRDRLSP